jgi:hypothetical protein
MAKENRFFIAAVLSANPGFQSWFAGAPFVYSDLNELANTLGIQHLERVAWQDAMVHIMGKKFAFRIITAITKGHLRQIVRAKREKVGMGSNLACG